MVKASVSIALIAAFLLPLTSPLFSRVDDCRIMCTRLEASCCESEVPLDTVCPSLARGRDTAPVFLPVAPSPSVPKFHLYPVISAGSPGIDSDGTEEHLGNLWHQFLSLPPKVSFYFLTHSLLL
ncbi:MAG: hypothetical protein ACE5HZ_08420 [Fidelibacterota bacterium]